LAASIRRCSLAWAVAQASVEEIDRLNILQASLLAMQRAVAALSVTPGLVLVDGTHAPVLDSAVRTLVRGDALEPAISAASILAKVTRDAQLCSLDALFPHYGFRQHKGYPTARHLSALDEHGPCPEHRRSFGPVRTRLR
jgi:ribonuclease HII